MSLYEELKNYGESDFYPYHMPGHKRRTKGELSEQLRQIDITEIDGFDNLHQAQGLLRDAQERANALYHADETFYLINGSTGGILSAVSATLPEKGHLLIARNCHKSVYHAAYLRHLRLSYIYPEMVPKFEFCEAVTAAQVRAALEREPDIGAVLIVSPTYEGRIADVKAIADIVHEKKIPLIVDEAHGAHLGMAEGFTSGSCMQGADLVIHSVHKTLTAMTQTALLHVNGDLVDRDRLRRFLRIYQSSSPSYVLMASIDDAMEFLEKEGASRFARFREAYCGLVKKLENCKVLRVIPWQEAEQGRQDIGKLVVYCPVPAKLLYDSLRGSYHLQCEMVAGNYCLAMFTLADGQEAYDRMEKALLEIDGILWDMRSGEPSYGAHLVGRRLQRLINDSLLERNTEPANKRAYEFVSGMASDIRYDFCEAWDKPWRLERLSEAVGGAMADFINLYPPGVPLLVPGEVLTEELYRQICTLRWDGLTVQGIEGADKVRVIISE